VNDRSLIEFSNLLRGVLLLAGEEVTDGFQELHTEYLARGMPNWELTHYAPVPLWKRMQEGRRARIGSRYNNPDRVDNLDDLDNGERVLPMVGPGSFT